MFQNFNYKENEQTMIVSISLDNYFLKQGELFFSGGATET